MMSASITSLRCARSGENASCAQEQQQRVNEIRRLHKWQHAHCGQTENGRHAAAQEVSTRRAVGERKRTMDDPSGTHHSVGEEGHDLRRARVRADDGERGRVACLQEEKRRGEHQASTSVACGRGQPARLSKDAAATGRSGHQYSRQRSKPASWIRQKSDTQSTKHMKHAPFRSSPRPRRW